MRVLRDSGGSRRQARAVRPRIACSGLTPVSFGP